MLNSIFGTLFDHYLRKKMVWRRKKILKFFMNFFEKLVGGGGGNYRLFGNQFSALPQCKRGLRNMFKTIEHNKLSRYGPFLDMSGGIRLVFTPPKGQVEFFCFFWPILQNFMLFLGSRHA